MNLITVKTFDHYTDVHILKSKIESEGIKCFIFDEHTVTNGPIYTWAIGGIKLKVKEEDVKKVQLILGEINETPLTNNEGQEICCPSCGSKKVNSGYGNPGGWKGVVLVFLAFISMTFAPVKGSRYYCTECMTGFRQEN